MRNNKIRIQTGFVIFSTDWISAIKMLFLSSLDSAWESGDTLLLLLHFIFFKIRSYGSSDLKADGKKFQFLRIFGSL